MHARNGHARLQCALFDLYGTTVDIEVDEDSPRLWHGLATAVRADAPVEASNVRRLFQTFLREEKERGREGFLMDAVFRRLLSSLNARDDVGRIGKLFRELSLKTSRVRPYVEPLFERLRRSGVKLGIVSNAEAVLTRFELDCYPILRTVQTIVLSSEVGMQKPDPRIFGMALEGIGAAPANTVFIGNDWAADVLGAQSAGLMAIYVNDRAPDGVRRTTDVSGAIEVAPTLDAIVDALRAFGWQEGG